MNKEKERTQLEFLKLQMHKGFTGKRLQDSFKQKWNISNRTYDRRLTLARNEIKMATPRQIELECHIDSRFVIEPRVVKPGQLEIPMAKNTLNLNESLEWLSTIAQGKCTRARYMVLNGEMVEVHETPNFNTRKMALIALIKYATTGMVDINGIDTQFLALEPHDFANISDEHMLELMDKFRAVQPTNKTNRQHAGK